MLSIQEMREVRRHRLARSGPLHMDRDEWNRIREQMSNKVKAKPTHWLNKYTYENSCLSVL